MRSAGMGEKGSETGRQGLGEGRENRNSEEEKYRQKAYFTNFMKNKLIFELHIF